MDDNVVGGRFGENAPAPIKFVRVPKSRVAPRDSQAVDLWMQGGEQRGEAHELDLLKYWRILVKRKLVVFAAVAVALGVGLVVTLLARPVYTATTTIEIDRESARVLTTQDVAPREEAMLAGDEFFQTQYGLLRSRSLAESVMDAMGLASSNAFLHDMTGKPVKIPSRVKSPLEWRRNQTLFLLQKDLVVTPVRGSRLVKVSFSSPIPSLATDVVNTFADRFIESNLQRRYEASSYARDFLEKHLAETKTKLEDSERQLAAYATKQQIINLSEPGPQGGVTQSLTAEDLQSLNAALDAAMTQRVSAEELWVQAKDAPPLGVNAVLENPTVEALSQQRAKLMSEYQDKLRVFKPGFPEMVQIKAEIDETNRQIQNEAANIKSALYAKYMAALDAEKTLRAKVATLKTDVLDLRNRSIQYNILQREVDTNRTLYEGLLQRFKEVGVAGGLATNNISIVDRAVPPQVPSWPKPFINMALAMIAGLGVGVVGAFGMEALDQLINLPEDLEQKLQLPLLGVIPLLEKEASPVEALADVRSAFAEAYYSVNTALQFSTAEGAPWTLMVTSSRPSEGKSTTTLAIATNFARVGARVLLIDADLRKPSLHKTLRVGNDEGLSNCLSGGRSLTEVVQETEVANLSVITSGPIPPNPAELLSGARMRALIADASSAFDFVVIDSPPVLGLADAPMLASMTVGCVFVAEARKTRLDQAKIALQRLEGTQARVIGGVLTKFNLRRASDGYGYGYATDYYSYGQDAPKKRIGKS